MQPYTSISNSQVAVKLAIFDVDKTFVRGDSFKWFCWFAIRANGICCRKLGRFVLDTLMEPAGIFDAGRIKNLCLQLCLVTNDRSALTSLVRKFVDGVLLKRVHSVALDRLRWHKQQKHRIMFLSASPDLYLNVLGARLGVDGVLCTKVLTQDGRFTGELFSANCKGDEKRRRLMEECPGSDIAWDQSYGYGNSSDDVPFLGLFGNAVAVNPDAKLRKIAVQRSWAIEAWS